MDKITHESISILCPAECEDGQVSQYDGEYYTTCERCNGDGIVFVIEASKVQAQVDAAIKAHVAAHNLHALCEAGHPGRALICDRMQGHAGRHSWNNINQAQLDAAVRKARLDEAKMARQQFTVSLNDDDFIEKNGERITALTTISKDTESEDS